MPRYLCLLLFLLLPQALPAAPEAYLVTYGPGHDVWERFGHNAIWIRDEGAGIDHSFSFGYFEIDRPGFYRDYARGIMMYYGGAWPVEEEMRFYRERDRSVHLQRLNLGDGQVRRLHGLLDQAVSPARQYYQYDYFFANCSTWIRDLLDQVLDGALAAQLRARPADQNFRDHTRRLTAERFWMHTGIMLGLGPLVDQPISAWEEAFLPAPLSRWLDTITVDGEPLVAAETDLFETTRFHPPETPPRLWPRYLALGLITAALILLPLRLRASAWQRLPLRLWLIANGAAGLLLIWLWLGTAHVAAWRNLMLLLLNPLWLGLLLPGQRGKKALWWILLVATLAGGVLMSIPGGPQYRLDQLAWLVPANLAALLAAWKCMKAGKEMKR